MTQCNNLSVIFSICQPINLKSPTENATVLKDSIKYD